MANTYLSKTFSSAGTRTKYTISVWVKRGELGSTQCIFSAGTDANHSMTISFNGADDRLYWNSYSNNGASYDYFLNCSRRFRDPNSWYHIVCAYDSTQGTSSNRQKIYVNGVQETAFETATYSGNFSDYAFNNILHEIGQDVGAGSRFFNGSMSYYYGIDGTAYAPTVFGETDSTDGIWKIKANPTVTMGTNGFLILKDGNTITDQSSNSNNWALGGGTLTPTKDNSDNNMSTLSPLVPFPSGLTMTNGNTSIASTAAQWAGRYSTQRVFSGKYYVEAQFVTGHNFKFGVQGEDPSESTNWGTLNTSYAGKSAVGYEFQCNNGTGYKVNNNSSPRWTESDFSTATSTIMMAFDLDNGKIWWGRNGTWFDSGGTPNPATGADPAFTGISTDKSPYLFGLSLEGNGSSSHINFGNGYYGTTAIGSPVTSNEGKWAYAPPSGFGAVNTKWINTF